MANTRNKKNKSAPKRKRTELDRMDHASSDVVLIGAKFICAKCQKWKDASKFGLRKMPSGQIRNQPRCTTCRRGSPPAKKSKKAA